MDSNTNINSTSTFKEVLEKFKILLTIIGTISIFIFYNPTGYSYIHWIKDIPYELTTSYVIYMFIGFLLLLPVFLDLPSAWKAAGFKGKFIFFVYLIFLGLIFYTQQWYEDKNNIIWAIESSVVLFMLWGAYVNYRDKQRYSVYGTQEQGSDDIDINI